MFNVNDLNPVQKEAVLHTDKQIKLAFAGTHSTGKTTVLNYLESVYKDDLWSVKEVARDLIKKGFPMVQQATEATFINLFNEYLKSVNNAPNSSIFISDRSSLDALGYALANVNLPEPKTHINEYFIEFMENFINIEKNNYDGYVYFPIEFSLVKDGIRDEDESYRKEVDIQIKKLLEKINVNYIEVRGTVEERANTIISFIESLKK